MRRTKQRLEKMVKESVTQSDPTTTEFLMLQKKIEMMERNAVERENDFKRLLEQNSSQYEGEMQRR